MKLRLRFLESNQTHRIEVPNSCNLHQLKQSIAHQLSLSSDGSLFLSLNRNHELSGSDDSLQTLGITSGDLIYYSFNSLAFSSASANLSNAQRNPSNQNRDVVDLPNPNLDESNVLSIQSLELVSSMKEGCSKLPNPNDENQNVVVVDSRNPNLADSTVVRGLTVESKDSVEGGCSIGISTNPNDKTRDLGKSKEQETEEDMEVDAEEESLIEENGKFSVPSFLKKVFVKEVGDVANGGDHKFLVIAIHAVLLESGFVAFDPISSMKINGFHLNDEWPKSAFSLSLHYTLPEVASFEVIETVVLKFQTLGKFLTVYGSVPKKGFGVHRVSLDETRFTPALSYILKNGNATESRKSYPNEEIFEFWKIVKDGLSYPLLIDLCEKTGLVPPPCFMLLPTELKLKILETLPAVNLARVCCVSSELHFLSSNNELWRSKYEEEFGDSSNPQRECQWKAKFSIAWQIRKNRKRVCMPYPMREPSLFRPFFPARRDLSFPLSPFTFGGDYDRMPAAFGIPRHHGPIIFRRNCHLGGLGP